MNEPIFIAVKEWIESHGDLDYETEAALGWAQDLLSWAADEDNVMRDDGTTLTCIFCEERDYGDGSPVQHWDFCAHRNARLPVVGRGDDPPVTLGDPDRGTEV